MRMLWLAGALLLLPAWAGAGPADDAKAAMQAGNYAEAYCLWRSLAERGDADAQYNLGWLYHNGYGLTINDQVAVRWWEKAAAQGHRDALFALGTLYRLGGRELPKDESRAVDYLLRAAEKGEEDAALMLRTLIARNDPAVRERAAGLLTRHGDLLGARLTVSAARANLRRGASLDHAAVAVLTEGEALIELSRRGTWVQVGIPASGQVGWISQTLVAPTSR